jgi:hypothetical protein
MKYARVDMNGLNSKKNLGYNAMEISQMKKLIAIRETLFMLLNEERRKRVGSSQE